MIRNRERALKLSKVFVEWRKAVGLTQVQAAEKAGISLGSLKVMETRGISTVEQVEILSEAYGGELDITAQVLVAAAVTQEKAENVEQFTPD